MPPRLFSGFVRHFVGGDQVAAAHLGAIESQLARHAVEQTFHDERALRVPGAAHRRHRHLVGERELHVHVIGRHFIGAASRSAPIHTEG